MYIKYIKYYLYTLGLNISLEFDSLPINGLEVFLEKNK